ncbi:MAG TPA: hypothetical protein VF579_07175 [Candidatus Methylomirabilis sp.]
MIFRDDVDRADFIARPLSLVEAGSLTVCAWALLPNHPHLLVRTGTRPLARSTRSLLTGNGRCSWRCGWGTRRDRAGVQDGAGASD